MPKRDSSSSSSSRPQSTSVPSSTKRIKGRKERPVFHMYIERVDEKFDPKKCFKLTPKPLTLKKLNAWCNSRFADNVENYGREMALKAGKSAKDFDEFIENLTFIVYNVTESIGESCYDTIEDAALNVWDLRVDERENDKEDREQRKKLSEEDGEDSRSECSEELDTEEEEDLQYSSGDNDDSEDEEDSEDDDE